MRLWIAGLLALTLAACDSRESSSPPVEEPSERSAPEVVSSPPVHPADPEADRLRVEWMRLEHAGWASAVSAAELAEPEMAVADSTPLLAIIIDDVGHSYVQGRRIIDLPLPVALAILPHTSAAGRLAAEAAEAGRAVMLHLPMENGAGLPIGPGGLYADMPRAQFEATLLANLDSFAPIQGVNNHMGSLLTQRREQMDWLMQALKKRGLFFVDSRTSAQTEAAFAAEAAGIRHLSRNVFLDNQRTPEAIDQAFAKGLALARKQGMAIIIGHPYAETLAYLEWRLPRLERQEGVRVADIEELLVRKYPARPIGPPKP